MTETIDEKLVEYKSKWPIRKAIDRPTDHDDSPLAKRPKRSTGGVKLGYVPANKILDDVVIIFIKQ